MKAKRLLAMVMASAMIMGMSVTAFAAPSEKPTENDNLDVTGNILNVEEGATITAYQVIDAVYNDSGFVKYEWVAGTNDGQDVQFDTEGNVLGLTNTYITSLASNTAGMTSTTDLTKLPAGTWMLLVTGSDLGKVYNPMIISVYYSVSGSDGTLDTGGVDASDSWTLETNGAYVKSQEVTIEKTVADTDDDTAEVGDIKTFTIEGEIPSYSVNSTAVYKITDNITNGLDYVLPEGEEKIAPTVTIGGNAVDAENYTVVMNGDDSFTITFDADYIKTLAAAGNNRTLVITYQAEVTEDAIIKVAENKAIVDYDQGSYESTEYVYTVNFDGAAKKVGVDEDKDGLAGATFTLYKNAVDVNDDGVITAEELALSAEVVDTYETTDNYDIEFKGLDASETYYLTETAAPDGYTINDTVYTITFNVISKEAGNISYEVLVDGTKVATVTAYNTPATGSTFEIENTKISSLPSTGGIGTTIFTIGGIVIMVAAAGLYFANRRKNNAE